MTTPASNLDWLYHLLGWLLAGAGSLLLLWALFRDRSRGHRRCPKCWYDMDGTPGLRCPECGREAPTERSLLRTRRRRRTAALSLLILPAGYMLSCIPEVRKLGWPSFIPSTALVFLAPAKPPPAAAGLTGTATALTLSEVMTAEAWSRHRRGQLAAWQSRIFLHRLLSPIAGEKPDSLVREALAPHLALDGGRAVLIIRDRERSGPPWTSIDFGIAFTYEVRVDGRIIDTGAGSSQWLFPTPRSFAPGDGPAPWQTREIDQAARAPGATITIRADRLAAAADYILWPPSRRAACWAGAFTAPLEFKEYPRKTTTEPPK